MKKIYNHKILSILSVFLFVLFIFTSNVFAGISDYEDSFPCDDLSIGTFTDRFGNEVTMPKIPADVLNSFGVNINNGFIIKFYNGSFSNIQFFEDNTKLVTSGNYIGSYNTDGSRADYKAIYYDYNTSCFRCTLFSDYYCGNKNEIIYIGSPAVIYNNLTDDSIFLSSTGSFDFFIPSPQGITATLVEEAMKAKIMGQIKTMIAGFLKYLIALVISVIAFYKGWKFLSTQLKKS